MIDFEAARRIMVDNQLRTSNVTDRRVLQAMGTVPRERFVPAERRALAYADIVQDLGGRSLAAPATFAKLLQLAEVQHGDHVLDIGIGTGYSAAVLSHLAASVTGLESDAALATRARQNLAEMAASPVHVLEGPLTGETVTERYDLIFVEGALQAVPETLFERLKEGGRLVALLGTGGAGVAHIFVRSGRDVASRSAFNATLPPLLPPAPAAFVF